VIRAEVREADLEAEEMVSEVEGAEADLAGDTQVQVIEGEVTQAGVTNSRDTGSI
jgi:hypothetical protein